ncbi:hypothetical protein [Celerinatantimonas yamalensis]|uniref:Uncharacterized protein n=1 Tax=Celerinatantimonas yamalensis TaxID=559956 RepID=A0ABW9G8P4_9GAMM
MISQYRVQLTLMSLVKLLALVGFGIGVIIGIATIFWAAIYGHMSIAQSLLSAIISPFSNAAIMGLFAVIGYPFYNWYCLRNRGLVLSGKFLEEQQQHNA